MPAIAVGSAGSAAARVSERAAPPSGWWKAADQALERGDCARAAVIPIDADKPPSIHRPLPNLTERWEQEVRGALLHGECLTARNLIERAIAEGNARGYAFLGEMYEFGRCAPLDRWNAATNYGEAVQRGYVLGAANLGYLVLNGLGAPSDPRWARRLFRLAALELAMSPPETRRSRLRLAMPYREIPEELEDALRWVRDLEDAEPEQLYQLALRLKIGDSLPHHAKLARQWLERASGQGVIEADYTLALWRLASPEQWYAVHSAMITLFSLSRKGYPAALLTYADQLAKGRYVVPNDVDAYTVLLIAEHAGADVDAVARQLSSRLTPEQRSFARTAAEVEAVPFFEIRPEWNIVKLFRKSVPTPKE